MNADWATQGSKKVEDASSAEEVGESNFKGVVSFPPKDNDTLVSYVA